MIKNLLDGRTLRSQFLRRAPLALAERMRRSHETTLQPERTRPLPIYLCIWPFPRDYFGFSGWGRVGANNFQLKPSLVELKL